MGTSASTRSGIRSDRINGKLPPAAAGGTADSLRRMRRNDTVATPRAPAVPHSVSRDARRTADDESAAATRIDAGVETLDQCVRRSLDQYFVALGGEKPLALREMVLQAVERPLLRFAMEKSAGNQSAAAQLLGINRNTLHKKLADYGLGSGVE